VATAEEERHLAASSISDLADELVAACLEYATEKHLPPMSIAVVDDGGSLVSFKRQAGAPELAQDAECAQRSVEAYSDGVSDNADTSRNHEGPLIVRRRLAEFERDFNSRDVASLIAQYHPSFVGILGNEFLDYEACTKRVRETLATGNRPSFKLGVNHVRLLGKTHVLANGVVSTTYAGKPPDNGLFTVIYGPVRYRVETGLFPFV
jgi:hypothetical protein